MEISGVMSVWATLLKNKNSHRKYDVTFHMKNNTKGTIIVMTGDISCSRGNSRGTLVGAIKGHFNKKHTSNVKNAETMNFGVDEEKTTEIICGDLEADEGDFQIIIHRIFDNPSNDGVTPGKVLATSLKWSLTSDYTIPPDLTQKPSAPPVQKE